MKKHSIFPLLILSLVFCQPVFAADAEDFQGELLNAVTLEENLVGSGTPSEVALKMASEKGYKTIIDVRAPEEGTASEEALAKKYGLEYINIPVTADNFSRVQADELNTTLESGAKPAILHCATGNRAAAVWAAYQKFYKGAGSESIISEASAKGLSKETYKQKLTEMFKA